MAHSPTQMRSAFQQTALLCIALSMAQLFGVALAAAALAQDGADWSAPGATVLPGAAPQLAVASGQSKITTGSSHACALTSTGGVKCWGHNFSGEIGDGTSRNIRLTPVAVSGLSSGVDAISAGGAHSCALTSVGGVKCWGSNGDSQLGDRTRIGRLTPVDVYGLASGVAAIATGGFHSCALTSAGGVKCWGWNPFGQLGVGTTISRGRPGTVSGLARGVAAIDAGAGHTCALTSAGGVKCWGYNNYGQLGDGTTVNRLTPVDVSDLSSGVIAIAAGGFHSCAVTSRGVVKCWGENDNGQLGDGTTINRLTPVVVRGLPRIIAITTGGYHSCALTSLGAARCWGGNDHGQLGDGTTINPLTPVIVRRLGDGLTDIAAGSGYSCAWRPIAPTGAGGVKCWGSNFSGQLGDGTTIERLTPVFVVGF